MKFEIPWEKDIYDCEWFDDTDFEKLDKVLSVLGFIFDDDGKMCVVNFKDTDAWSLPGGHLEDYDKDFEACLIRETVEEADLELKDISRIGYMSSIKRGGGEDTRNNQLRYVARVHKINEQTVDPAEGYIPERKFIDPSEFTGHVKWNSNGEHQLKRALKVLEKSKKRVAQVEGIIFRKVDDNYEFLMLKRIADRGGFWQPVTGGCEEGECIKDALLREVREETGLDELKEILEDVHSYTLTEDGIAEMTEYIFGVEVAYDREININNNIYPEHDEFRWCSYDEALDLLEWDGNKEGLRKLKEMLE